MQVCLKGSEVFFGGEDGERRSRVKVLPADSCSPWVCQDDFKLLQKIYFQGSCFEEVSWESTRTGIFDECHAPVVFQVWLRDAQLHQQLAEHDRSCA